VTAGGSLRLALPGLAELVGRGAEWGGVPRLASAEWLFARARRQPGPAPAWRDWLLSGATGLGAELLARFPAGTCARLQQPGLRQEGTWARAEPVHLLTAIDHLQLAAPVPLPLAPDESDELLATINDHCAGRGFAFHRLATPGWVAECPAGLAFEAVEPAAAVGRNLRGLLPSGRDAARVRSIVNEIQMLLHEHPVNDRRARQGKPTVNSVWLWGAGAVVAREVTVQGTLLTDDDWLAALWRVHGGQVRPPAELAAELQLGGAVVRAGCLPALASGGEPIERLRRLEQSVLGPAHAALVAGRFCSIALHTGQATFEVPARARRWLWRRPRPLPELLR